ncbi:MAG TPA: serine protease [Xanthobacteraceae bacterium]|nr:serine protease [Xanthobacteraceae bacterium]
MCRRSRPLRLALSILLVTAVAAGASEVQRGYAGKAGAPRGKIDLTKPDQAETPGTRAAKLPGERANVFDSAQRALPLSELPLKPRAAGPRSAADIKRALVTTSVTRDGRVEKYELSPAMQRRILEGIRLLEREKNRAGGVKIGAGAREGGGGPRPPREQRQVLGSDDRERVTDTTVFPFRAMGYLGTGCSGTLVGPRHVLTAGHCVYNTKTDKWYENVDFWPGQNGEESPYGRVAWKRTVSVQGWTRDHEPGYDYGMVILQEDVGRQVGWLGFGYKEPMPLYSINFVGYPGDKPKHTMWRQYCDIKEVTDTELFYDCDNTPGMSGGPLYVYTQDDNERTIYGINAYQYFNREINSGTRIDRARFEVIRGWTRSY